MAGYNWLPTGPTYTNGDKNGERDQEEEARLAQFFPALAGLLWVYCVEKIDRQQFWVITNVRLLGDR
jgi:hypothetical protein